MSWAVVLPCLDARRSKACLSTLAPVASAVIVVDNTPAGLGPLTPTPGRYVRTPARPGCGHNAGVAASWNAGVRWVLRNRLDHLVLCSTSLRFGPSGLADFCAALAPGEGAETVHGWHLLALPRVVFERCGLFDECFWPAYYEDTDLLYRMGLAGLPSPRENGQPLGPTVAVDATDEGYGLHIGAARPDFGTLGGYYEAKWGGPQGHEQYRHPFDDVDRHLSWCPPPGDPRHPGPSLWGAAALP